MFIFEIEYFELRIMSWLMASYQSDISMGDYTKYKYSFSSITHLIFLMYISSKYCQSEHGKPFLDTGV